MEVCTVCGALLVVGDAQQRVEEHIMGKQHSGYARIRSFVEQKILVSVRIRPFVEQKILVNVRIRSFVEQKILVSVIHG